MATTELTKRQVKALNDTKNQAAAVYAKLNELLNVYPSMSPEDFNEQMEAMERGWINAEWPRCDVSTAEKT